MGTLNFSDADLKINVNFWIIFNLVWFQPGALFLCDFTDHKKNPDTKREEGSKIKPVTARAWKKIETIIVNFTVICIIVNLY